MNPALDDLKPYPFERLAALLKDVQPADKPAISLAIGEPQHDVAAAILAAYQNSLGSIAHYPATAGSPALREGIAQWLQRRFQLAQVDAGSQVLPVNGTREALFAFAQAVIDSSRKPLVVMPNPFYQIYEGATLLAGADSHYLNCTAENDFLPDLDVVPAALWQRCQLLYLCSPGNPTGAVMPLAQLQRAIELAHTHDFIIAADECYSEIYPDEAQPPVGLLQAAQASGVSDYSRCVVFHSLSKRSNLPGLRSGFVAGDANILKAFLRYRTYHGCAMSPAVQATSMAAWADETHVQHNRELYRQKFAAVLPILQPLLDVCAPDASFYLWPQLPMDDQLFVRELLARENLRAVPGSYLARDTDAGNPGRARLRLSLVASVAECTEAAHRIAHCLHTLG